MSVVDWQPGISKQRLQQRAYMLARVRKFFAEREVLEVETPLLGRHAVTDPHLLSLQVRTNVSTRFLQTSPEFAMKRMLAAGAGDIYQICKAFRAQESGVNHNPEFTLIEWYRRGFSLQKMMQETVELINGLLYDATEINNVVYVSHSEAVRQKFGVPMSEMSASQLETFALDHGLKITTPLSKEQLFDFVFSSEVVPTFKTDKLTVVFDYPASQASLAKLNSENPLIAQRFEVFCGGRELANGFVELTDASEQLHRFECDQQERSRRGLPPVDVDYRLIAAMQHGLPECAGVAVGFDRIVMLACNATSIGEVLSFDWASA